MKAFAERPWPACHSAFHFDRFLCGELPAAEAAELRAHLEGCARCTALVDSLRPGEELPALRVVPWRKPLRWPRAAAAVAGLAAAASLLLILRPPTPSERSKGSGFSLEMYVLHGGAVRRAAPGETVAPGDSLRFSLTAPAAGYAAVLSLDPQGRASVYFPLEQRAAPLGPGRDLALPIGTRLDATVGEERLTAIFCASAVELEPLRAALERGRLQLPAGCEEARWSFVKR